MKRMTHGTAGFFLAAVLVFSFAPARGGEWTLKDWLKELDAKVRRTEDKHKGRVATAAAVRGSKQESEASKKLYWKGKKKAQPVTEQELDEFKAALALAKDGQTVEAERALSMFMEKRPDSPLAADAKQTLALMKESANPGVDSVPAGAAPGQ